MMAIAPAYMDVANSPWLWLAAVPVVLVVLLQSGIFLRRAWQTGEDVGLSDDQLKSGVRTGVISAIGPTIPILAGMLVLIATIGAPVAWMRLSVIGSVAYELPVAALGLAQFGYDLGEEGITRTAYATAVWAMSLGGTGWLLVTAFGTPYMEKGRQKIAGNREKLVPVISSAAMLGAFSYFLSGEITAGTPEAGSVAAGGLAMLGLLRLADEKDIQWVREWALGIAMIVGLFAGLTIQLTIGSWW